MTLHTALMLLNRYRLKVGIKESLVEQDRFLVALACYLIATKAHSHFVHGHKFLEFYYLNRPLNPPG